MEELSGIVDRVRFRNSSGFIILEVRTPNGLHTVSGSDCDIHEADVVKCTGAWSTYNGESQFKASNIIPEIPSTEEAIFDYLSAGRIKGVSNVLAARLVAEFGSKTLEIIENHPEKLRKVKGFGLAKTKALTEGIRDQIGYRSILVFLHGFGLSKRHISRIYKHYGVKAVEAIKANPYELCIEVEGIGFTIADRIGLRSGVAHDSEHRVFSGVVHAMHEAISRTGDTGLPRAELEKESFNLLNREGPVDRKIIVDALEKLVSSNHACVLEIDGVELVFPKYLYEAEKAIGNAVLRLNNQYAGVASKDMRSLIAEAEGQLGITLAPEQKQAVMTSSNAGISVITGGPGTGKTTIIRTMLRCLMRGFGYTEDDILLCAPTGKAAKRIEETTGMSSMTMHRALSFCPEKGGFLHDEYLPLEAKIIVVDEASMVDTWLMASFMKAVGKGSQLIILGDVDQLRSVGPGKVLHDMIESGTIAVTRLVDIYRQGNQSDIIINAHKVNRGEVPVVVNGKDTDFWFIRTGSDEELADKLVGLVARVSRYFNIDAFNDVQILTPQHRGLVGQALLNKQLQASLNPTAGEGIKVRQGDVDVEFKVGDKVMHTKNNKDMDVYNGDTGRVASVDLKQRTLVVLYDEKPVEYSYIDLEHLRLSYAMTIHKSQGSEYPCVIIVCSSSHYAMLNRSLFYTAITRGKGMCVMVGEPRALKTAVERTSSDTRNTGLVYHLQARCAALAA